MFVINVPKCDSPARKLKWRTKCQPWPWVYSNNFQNIEKIPFTVWLQACRMIRNEAWEKQPQTRGGIKVTLSSPCFVSNVLLVVRRWKCKEKGCWSHTSWGICYGDCLTEISVTIIWTMEVLPEITLREHIAEPQLHNSALNNFSLEISSVQYRRKAARFSVDNISAASVLPFVHVTWNPCGSC